MPLSVLDKLNPVPAGFLKQVRLRHAAQTRRLPPDSACAPAARGRHGRLSTAARWRAAPGASCRARRALLVWRLRSALPQVWELDNDVFVRHVTPSVLAYAEETATLLRELDMARPRARSSAGRLCPDAWRAELRVGSRPWPGWRSWSGTRLHRQAGRRCGEAAAVAVAQEPAGRQRQHPAPRAVGACVAQARSAYGACSYGTLRRQAGSSRRLYTSLVAFCRQHYAGGGPVAACTLRSQLLMALHDAASLGNAASATAFKEVCEPDKCHKLAWCLDACVKVRAPVALCARTRALISTSPRCRTATATSGGSRRLWLTLKRLRRLRLRPPRSSASPQSSHAAPLLIAKTQTARMPRAVQKKRRCQTLQTPP